MNPLTADNNDGRVLLALRAGPMTPSELNERSLNFRGWLIKSGYVEQVGDYYRITEAGRAACPFRNPLAATLVAPARQEIKMTMPQLKREDVLHAVAMAGEAGIEKRSLVDKFDHLVNHYKDLGAAITSHLVTLKADGLVTSPQRGVWLAVCRQENGLSETQPDLSCADETQTNADAPSDAWEPDDAHPANRIATGPAPLLPEMEELQAEQIEIKGVADRRAPVVMAHPDDTEIGIFSNGRIEISDEFNSLILTDGVVRKLRAFLGLFQEAA